MLIEFKLLRPEAKEPYRSTEGAAAFDLVCPEQIIIHPGFVVKIPLGFAMALSLGHCAFILPRSGMASSRNLRPANTPGLIDSDYRGEVIVALENFGRDSQKLTPGDRVAQMMICHLPLVQTAVVEELSQTLRGSGGFGSTGENIND